MENIRLTHLYELLINGTATEEERDEFARLATDSRYSNQAKTLVSEALGSNSVVHKVDSDVTDSIINAIVNASGVENTGIAKLRPLKISWVRYAAAVLIILCTATFLLVNTRSKINPDSIITKHRTDFAAGGKKAILTLADGREIMLDSSSSGELAQQGNSEIFKLADGEILYNKKTGNNSDAAVMMNTMSTPRGGQYQLKLHDGTKVWLNAASSITYPAVFTGNERKVSITGEAYFEVVKDTKRPFKVTVDNSSEIEVLGTSFNVNSYKEESLVTTTLLEGSIRTSLNNRKSVVLTPHQQAVTGPDKNIKVFNDVSVDKVMAWKNGLFNFDNASLEQVMRQISRWYDIEVVYEKGIPAINFGGEVSMNVSLAGLLDGLEKANVHFRIENNRRLVVTP